MKNVVKDRYEAPKPTMLKGILRGKRKNKNSKGRKGEMNLQKCCKIMDLMDQTLKTNG